MYRSMEHSFLKLIMTLQQRRVDMPRTLVYCRYQDHCGLLYRYMRAVLGAESTHPPGAPNVPKNRLFDCYAKGTAPTVRACILLFSAL